MRCAAASGNVTGAATKTVIAIYSTAVVMAELEQIIFSASGTPADAVALFAIRSLTAADGTGTAKTEFNLDRNGGAPSCTTKADYSVEPTYASGNMIEIAINQRATFPWTLPPGVKTAIGTANGIGIQMISGPAVAWNLTLIWTE
jgi:hypothetical protein